MRLLYLILLFGANLWSPSITPEPTPTSDSGASWDPLGKP